MAEQDLRKKLEEEYAKLFKAEEKPNVLVSGDGEETRKRIGKAVFGRDFSNASNRFSSGNVANNPLNTNAFPKLKNIVPTPAPSAVSDPRITDSASAGIAPIGTQNHLAFFG